MSAHARPIDALPVRIDAVHEFFDQPQKACNEAAQKWEAWFKATGVRYERRDLSGRRFQLYVHRLKDGAHGLERVRVTAEYWCCGKVPISLFGRRSA